MGTPADAAGPDFRDPPRKETTDWKEAELETASTKMEETKMPNAKEGEEAPTPEKEFYTPETASETCEAVPLRSGVLTGCQSRHDPGGSWLSQEPNMKVIDCLVVTNVARPCVESCPEEEMDVKNPLGESEDFEMRDSGLENLESLDISTTTGNQGCALHRGRNQEVLVGCPDWRIPVQPSPLLPRPARVHSSEFDNADRLHSAAVDYDGAPRPALSRDAQSFSKLSSSAGWIRAMLAIAPKPFRCTVAASGTPNL
ncbi:hypothetical protein NDU88_004110 [Pleurodeles waltl]|uniref:Uncharacterized protein n=1 Tax=Pleurodeles waltl TaxID=8319 RepID=A0AAV7T700_PLEWA|nr:hypothetical protein NDU88_004110 [Pleurodeles waltl]